MGRTHYPGRVPLPRAVRLVAGLNGLALEVLTPHQTAGRVVGADVAHHVVDEDGLITLNPLQSTELEALLGVLPRQLWVLALPRPGNLGGLRGPAELVAAALAAGAAVVAADGGLAFVPHVVGPGVQWQLLPASAPATPPGLYEAERALNELVLEAGPTLARLDTVSGTRPRASGTDALGPAYGRREQLAADKALRLIGAAEAGLADESGVLSSFAAERRGQVLRQLRDAAADCLVAAASRPSRVN